MQVMGKAGLVADVTDRLTTMSFAFDQQRGGVGLLPLLAEL